MAQHSHPVGTATKRLCRNKFRDVIPGIKGYSRLTSTIDWLQAAGLIIKPPITNKAALTLTAFAQENSFKLFFHDIGMLGAISKLPPKTILDYQFGTYKVLYG